MMMFLKTKICWLSSCCVSSYTINRKKSEDILNSSVIYLSSCYDFYVVINLQWFRSENVESTLAAAKPPPTSILVMYS